MTWKEAVKYMKEEKGKVTRKHWLVDDYLYMEDGRLMCDGFFEYLGYLQTTRGEWIKHKECSVRKPPATGREI